MQFKIILLLQIILNTFYIIIHDIAILTFTYNFDINKKETVGIVNKRILFFVSRVFHKFHSLTISGHRNILVRNVEYFRKNNFEKKPRTLGCRL